MTAAACSLSPGELAAQLDRYRALGRTGPEVQRRQSRVIVRFSEDPPAALLEQTIEVERGCCPFFLLDYDPDVRRLTITAVDAEHRPGLDALAQALALGGATEPVPTAGNELPADDLTRAGCCSSTAFAVCCDTEEKGTCRGEATTAPPAQCGCRA